MTTENTSNNVVNPEIVEACQKVNKSFLNGYGRISKFVRQLVDLDKGEIEGNIAAALDGLNREEITKLDKAYQMASKRNLDFTFGLGWDKEEQKGYFRIPAPRTKGATDEFMKTIKAFAKHPEDHDLCVKALRAVVEKHTKACKNGPAFELDLNDIEAIEPLTHEEEVSKVA